MKLLSTSSTDIKNSGANDEIKYKKLNSFYGKLLTSMCFYNTFLSQKKKDRYRPPLSFFLMTVKVLKFICFDFRRLFFVQFPKQQRQKSNLCLHSKTNLLIVNLVSVICLVPSNWVN